MRFVFGWQRIVTILHFHYMPVHVALVYHICMRSCVGVWEKEAVIFKISKAQIVFKWDLESVIIIRVFATEKVGWQLYRRYAG